MKTIAIKIWAGLLLSLSLACSNAALDIPGNPSLATSDRSASVTGNVRLVSATSQFYCGFETTYIVVHAANVGSAASRSVLVHYKTSTGWVDQPMVLDTAYDTHSLYWLSIAQTGLEFALKYQTDAGTWWDNNGGANYKVAYEPTAAGFQKGAVGGNIGLLSSWVQTETLDDPNIVWSGSKVTVDLAVENLSYNKKVGVRYSINGGNWFDMEARYSGKLGGQTDAKGERWTAVIKGFPASGSYSLRFALYYKNLDTGKTWWDNNFTKNYQQAVVVGNEVK